jgi:hypothetical protein
MILDVNKLTIGRYGWFRRTRYHWGGFILIEIDVVVTVAQRVFGSVERFPVEQAY